MQRTRWKRRAQAGLVVAVACILPLGCASSTAGVADRPDQDWSPAMPVAPEVDTLPGEHLGRIDAARRPANAGPRSGHRPGGCVSRLTSVGPRHRARGEPRFRVLSERDLEPAEVITLPADSHGPEVAAALTASLTYMADQNRVPESLQITIKPLTGTISTAGRRPVWLPATPARWSELPTSSTASSTDLPARKSGRHRPWPTRRDESGRRARGAALPEILKPGAMAWHRRPSVRRRGRRLPAGRPPHHSITLDHAELSRSERQKPEWRELIRKPRPLVPSTRMLSPLSTSKWWMAASVAPASAIHSGARRLLRSGLGRCVRASAQILVVARCAVPASPYHVRWADGARLSGATRG